MNRKQYYNNKDIQFEIIYQQMHHETFFLPYSEIDGKLKSTPPIRWLNASAIKFLQMHWDRYLFLDKPMNLYHSLATYKDFPTFSYNWRIKSQQQKIWLTEFASRVIKYDLFLETDCEDIMKAHAESIEIMKFLNKYNARFYVKFSGSKGFHFVIPYEEFSFLDIPVYDNEREMKVKDFRMFLRRFPLSQRQKSLDIVMLFKVIAHKIKTLLALDTVDTSVQDVKRVIKTAYSWDVKSNLIAYPLDDVQFLRFSKILVKPENVVLYNNNRRRLLWRNYDKQPRMKEMLADLGIFR